MADDFNGIDPGFVNALQGLMGACGLSLTSGYRTYDEQADLYRRKPNLAAPPGRSNHEDGLAADIAGDLDCAHQRAAEFGLHFPMDHEPWHIEPLDMTRTDASYPAPSPEEDPLAGLVDAVFGQTVPSRAFTFDRDEVETERALRATRQGAGQAGGDDPGKRMGDTFERDSGQTATPQTGAVTSGASLSTEDIARAYQSAGFSGEALVTMVAISLGESGGNPRAQNLNASEDSRGLSQINTYAHPQYNKEQLYDPYYNAQAAYEVSGGGENFGPWTVYSKGMYEQYLDEARAAVAAIGGGAGASALTTTTPEQQQSLAGSLDTPGGGRIGPVLLEDVNRA